MKLKYLSIFFLTIFVISCFFAYRDWGMFSPQVNEIATSICIVSLGLFALSVLATPDSKSESKDEKL